MTINKSKKHMSITFFLIFCAEIFQYSN